MKYRFECLLNIFARKNSTDISESVVINIFNTNHYFNMEQIFSQMQVLK